MNTESFREDISFAKIASELKKMVVIDQDMRERNQMDSTVDARHTERMKEIVDEIGWPTISKVGKDASHKAWVLVQHADHDLPFQQLCLSLMKEASISEVNVENIVYLEDRLRVSMGQKQLYGTQFYQDNNQHIPEPIEDEVNVNTRRALVGMGPLQDQIDMMYRECPFDSDSPES